LLSFFSKKEWRLKSDDELIVIYKKSQKTACIDVFYERYAHLLLSIAVKYLRNIQDAEDVVMELFHKLGDKIQKHEIQNFKSWLHTTIRNECLMLLRKNNNVDESIDIVELPELSQPIISAEEKERNYEMLEGFLGQLKPDQKKSIELFFFEGKSYIEIADSLQLSLMQVKSAIQNGKRRLKISLEKQGVNTFTI
jgi:RNA polymerase sigma-70 factor (ECF subfamily)